MHHTDAGRVGVNWAIEIDGDAVDPHRAAIRRMHPGDDLDQRGFARAVLADERVDAAGRKADRNVLQRVHPWEGLIDI